MVKKHLKLITMQMQKTCHFNIIYLLGCTGGTLLPLRNTKISFEEKDVRDIQTENTRTGTSHIQRF